MDTQTTEILGRNRLVADLLVAGLEVAMPLRDRGIDLIAYLDLAVDSSRFAAIQMKAATTKSFSIDSKYAKFSNLIIAYVWEVGTPGKEQIYALTYPEVLHVAEQMKWTGTASWAQGTGTYSTTAPSKKLCRILEEYKMSSDRWQGKITGLRKDL